jgi:hypothetical protein
MSFYDVLLIAYGSQHFGGIGGTQYCTVPHRYSGISAQVEVLFFSYEDWYRSLSFIEVAFSIANNR